MSQVHSHPPSKGNVWGNAHLSRSFVIEGTTDNISKEDRALQKRFDELPPAFRILEHEDAQAIAPHDDSLREYDEIVLKSVLHDAFTVDPSIKANRVVTLNPKAAWGHMYIFKERGLVLYFTGRLP